MFSRSALRLCQYGRPLLGSAVQPIKLLPSTPLRTYAAKPNKTKKDNKSQDAKEVKETNTNAKEAKRAKADAKEAKEAKTNDTAAKQTKGGDKDKKDNKKSHKGYRNENRPQKEYKEEQEDDVEERALSVKDESASKQPILLRHQHTSPIPGQKHEITEHAVAQRDLQMRQEILREKKQEILTRVRTLATMDTSDVDERVKYESIEEAYKTLKQEFDDALALRKPEEVYEVLTSMRNMGLRLPKKSYDAVAVLFAQEQHIYKVTDVWEFMKRDQVLPDQESYMNVVDIYCDLVHYEWAMKTFFQNVRDTMPEL